MFERIILYDQLEYFFIIFFYRIFLVLLKFFYTVWANVKVLNRSCDRHVTVVRRLYEGCMKVV